MSELTPEEKRRIYEEEKTRIEAQQQIKRKYARKTKPRTWGCLILISLIVIIIIVSYFKIPQGTGTDRSTLITTQEKEEIELNVEARFTGTQFIIVNKNDFIWTNVKLDINTGTFRSGYVYRVKNILPNKKYTIGAAQFTKSDGTRLNPFVIKPKTIFIICDTPKGRAYYTGGWD